MSKTVVIIDPTPLVRIALRDSLTTVGYKVVDGASVDVVAGQLARLGSDTEVTAVVVDFWMDGHQTWDINGFRAVHGLERRFGSEWRIVVTSDDPDPHLAERVHSTGAAFLRKPFGLANLLSAIEPHAEGRPRAA